MPGGGVIDRAQLDASFRGDEDILYDLIRSFLVDAPAMVREMAGAIERGDGAALSFKAHELKGVVANFYCKPAKEAAWGLESVGKRGALLGAPAALEVLKSELDALYAELRDIIGAPPAPR